MYFIKVLVNKMIDNRENKSTVFIEGVCSDSPQQTAQTFKPSIVFAVKSFTFKQKKKM